MQINISEKIKRMILRRQKIAIKKLINARISQLDGVTLNRTATQKSNSTLYADVYIKPRVSVEKANIKFIIQNTPS